MGFRRVFERKSQNACMWRPLRVRRSFVTRLLAPVALQARRDTGAPLIINPFYPQKTRQVNLTLLTHHLLGESVQHQPRRYLGVNHCGSTATCCYVLLRVLALRAECAGRCTYFVVFSNLNLVL